MESCSERKRITVAALVPYALDTTPSQRFRIEQWGPCLAAAGIDLAFSPFADMTLMRVLQEPGRTLRKILLTLGAIRRRLSTVSVLERGRIVFLHRAACLVGPPIVERILAARGHPLIYDFDDAIYLLHTAAVNRATAWLKQPSKTATVCRLSQQVVVGNAHLASWAGQHAARVTVVPTSIDTDRYLPRERGGASGRVVVGWSGSSTSQTYLEAFATMLRTLVSDHDVELRVLSTRAPELPGVPHTWKPWSAATEIEEISAFDIGIMPMPDEEWALGKCALKALQYMALAVPTVASAVGANREVIAHGKNGFLATGSDEWRTALRALILDRQLRNTIGAAGRCTVEEGYSMRRSAGLLEAVVRETAAGVPAP